jgi:hypothetical protein
MRISSMTRFKYTTTGLGLVLALTLASCNTVSTQAINDQVVEPTTLSSGALAQITPGHPTSGTAKLIKLADGSYVARFENLSTVGGPDVHVWASEGSDLSNSGTVGSSKYTDLGSIKSTNGNQNYVVALSATEVGKIKSIIIWCKSFSVAFGGATLK